ncbi:hypothetical protein ACFL5P_02485, partial [candidate division KSB1 bacterium]
EIFAANCISIGLPVLTVTEKTASELRKFAMNKPDSEINIDIKNKIISNYIKGYNMRLPETFYHVLINGKWDSTSVLLENKNLIEHTVKKIPYLNNYKGIEV